MVSLNLFIIIIIWNFIIISVNEIIISSITFFLFIIKNFLIYPQAKTIMELIYQSIKALLKQIISQAIQNLYCYYYYYLNRVFIIIQMIFYFNYSPHFLSFSQINPLPTTTLLKYFPFSSK